MESAGHRHIQVVGDGAASLLGDATCETSDQIQYPDGTGAATYTLRAPNGTIVMRLLGHAKPNDPATPFGTFEILGGSHLYHGAKGAGTFSASVQFD